MSASIAESPLHTGYSFWYMRRGKNMVNNNNTTNNKSDETTPTSNAASSTNNNGGSDQPQQPQGSNPYENAIRTISTVKTVEQFWETYNWLERPNDLPNTTDYHFFREGIKPTWEDPSNAKGGKWAIRLRKGLASRYWEESLLALIGGQFPGVPEGEICGVVVSIRYSEDILGIWNRTASDRDITERIRDAIKKVLQLPSHAFLEYKPHQTSVRNTQVWKPNSMSRSDRQGSTSEPRRSGSWSEHNEARKSKSRDLERSWR